MKPIAHLNDDEFSGMVRAAVDMPDAPTAWVKSATALFPAAESSPLSKAADAVLSRVQAVLSFDSWAVSQTALGLRSSHSTQSRQMMFSAPGRDIDVRIVSANDSYVLAGQILGPDEAGAVELSVNTEQQSARLVHTTTLDDLGSFHVDNLRAGTYWMTLHLNEQIVELPPIQVGGLS